MKTLDGIRVVSHLPDLNRCAPDDPLGMSERACLMLPPGVASCHLRQAGRKWRRAFGMPDGGAVWELPGTSTPLQELDYEDLEVVVDLENGHSFPHTVKRQPGLQFPEGREVNSPGHDQERAEELYGFVCKYTSAHREAAEQYKNSVSRRHDAGFSRVDPEVVLRLLQATESSSEPPDWLIVKVARQTSQLLASICRSPRRVLRKQRARTRVDRVKKLDTACMRWLARQPGHTHIERAGPRQRVRAVIRETHFDTLENRVLKDFLHRCRRKARTYLRTFKDKSTSARHRDTAAFLRLVGRLLRSEHMPEIAPLNSPPSPNYALLHDARYQEMWGWYLRICRDEDELVRGFSWRESLWGEAVRLTIAGSMRKRSRAQDTALEFSERIYISDRMHSGALLSGPVDFGPWAMRERGLDVEWILFARDSFECLATEEEGFSWLFPANPEAVLLGRMTEKEQFTVAIPIWTALEKPIQSAHCVAILKLLESLQRPDFHVSALIVAFGRNGSSSQHTETGQGFRVQVSEGDLTTRAAVQALDLAVGNLLEIALS